MEGINLKEKLIQQNIITSGEWQHCIEIYKLCQQFNVNLSSMDILLECYISSFDMQQLYLETLIHKWETPEITNIIDFLSLEIGKNWQDTFDKNKLVDQEYSCDMDMYNNFIEEGLNYPSTYTYLIKNNKRTIGNLSDIDIRRGNYNDWDINIQTLCQVVKNNEFLPLHTKLDKLIGKSISFSLIEEAQKKQKEISERWKCNIPLTHLLIKKYKIEPYLIHALLISQLRIEKNIEVWLSGLFITSFPKTETLVADIEKIQKEIKHFLERIFTLSWLKFKPEKEVLLLEELQKFIPPSDWKKMVHIREHFAKNKFAVPLLKLLVLNNIISEALILKNVLEKIYNVSEKQAQEITKKICGEEAKSQQYKEEDEDDISEIEPDEDEDDISEIEPELEDALSIISLGDSEEDSAPKLQQTMAMPSIKKVSQKTAQLDDKAASQKLPQKTINPVSASSAKRPSAAAERIKQSLQKSLKKAEASANSLTTLVVDGHIEDFKHETIEMRLTPDFLKLRGALKKKYVSEEQMISSVILQSDPSTNFYEQNILEILHSQAIITQEMYDELNQELTEDQHVKVPVISSNMNLHIGNAVVQYNIGSREQVQKALRLQKTLQKLFISRTLDKVFVQAKILPADIIEPLVDKIKQNLKKTVTDSSSESIEGIISFEPLKSKDKKVSTSYKLALVGIFLCLGSLSIYNFYKAYYGVMESQQVNLTDNNNNNISTNTNTDGNTNTNTNANVNTNTNANTNTNVQETNENTQKMLEIIRKKQEEGMVGVGNDIYAKKEELKEKLSGTKTKAFFPIDLKTGTQIRAFDKKESHANINIESYGILVASEFSVDPMESLHSILVQVELFGGFQAVSYKTEMVSLSAEYKFSTILAPFDKPLAPNLYYIKISIPAIKQDPSIRKFYELRRNLEWWVPYVHLERGGKKEHIFREMNGIEENIKRWALSLKEHNANLINFLNQNSKDIRRNYAPWEKNWLERHLQLKGLLEEKIKKYFIPIHPRTEKQLEKLLKEVDDNYLQLKNWVTSLELFPPQASNHRWDLEWSKYQLYLKEDQESLKIIMEKLKR